MSGKRIACPAHGGRDPNCSLWRDGRGWLRAKCWSHGCAERDILVALGERERHFANHSNSADSSKHLEIARRTWGESKPASGTLVERYLRSRGITLSIPASIRFYQALRHPTGVYGPAMVAAVQNGTRIVAVHRTYLRSDGSGKALFEPNKALLGPAAGAAIRFAPAGDTLALAEGIESGLTIAQARRDLPVWSALSASNMRRVEIPPTVREVIVAADADEAGEAAAQAAARRFLREGREVVRIARTGRQGVDFNDLISK